MWWWISGALALGAVVLLVMVITALRRDLAELQRVAQLSTERSQRGQQRVQAKVEQVQHTVLEVQQRAAATAHRVGALSQRPDR